jgi:hypothetical protein
VQALAHNNLPERTFTYPDGIGTMAAMTVYETRWRNFRALIGSEHGAITDAAKRLEKSQGQVSHFGGAKPIKNIGHKLARQIEQTYGKPEGWLDHEQFSLLSEGEQTVSDSLGKTITSVLVSPSQPARLDPHILVEAEKWVLFEEGPDRRLAYPLLPRAERLSAIYAMILADGGTLSPESSKRLIEAAALRLQGKASDRVEGDSRAARDKG